MMPTALQLISRSMRLIGTLDGSGVPTADEQTDGLAALRAMLDTWGAQANSVYAVRRESFTWSSGQVSQTLGSGGDLDTTRPIRIVGMWQTLTSIDYPIEILSEASYAGIADKTTGSTIIERIYPDYDYPTMTLRAWPVPSSAATVVMRSHKALQDLSTATTELSMPEGYEDAIAFNLAIRLAPEYQREVPQAVARTAASSLRTIKTRNIRPPTSVIEPAYMGGQRGTSFSVYRGD